MRSLMLLGAVGTTFLQLGSSVVFRGGGLSEPIHNAIEIWIAAFPRSASSTLWTMMNVSSAENDVFMVYEPCHDGDVTTEPSCQTLLSKMAGCDFAGVENLWGWEAGHYGDYDKNFASKFCAKSKARVFKTVAPQGMKLDKSLWVLEWRPEMKILQLVRDPRAIVNSMMKIGTDDFNLDEAALTDEWHSICDSYAANLDVTHSRIKTVFMEDMIRSPEKFMQEVYEFLGFDFGQYHLDWLSATFPPTNDDCDVQISGAGKVKLRQFADCHGRKEALEELDAWRDTLGDKEREAVVSYPACQRVLKAYGYPTA